MKVALLALGIIAAGVVGGVTSDLLRPEQVSTPVDNGRGRLEAQIADLQTLVARQGTEIRALRDAAVVPAEPTRLADAPALEADAEDPAAAASEGELESKVAEILAKKEQEERDARTQRFTAMFEERDKARLKRIQDELGLTDYQAEELDKIFAQRRDARTGMMGRMFSGDGQTVDQEEIAKARESMQKLQTDTEEQIKSLLGDGVYESYKKLDTGRRGGGGGGGGMFGGGRPPR